MQTPVSVPSIGLVIVGDEILSGKRQDKHMAKVIELLSARGLSLSHVDYVGDVPHRLTQTLQRAFEQPGVVFSCGGIGATPDDHTRQSAAKALGVSLAGQGLALAAGTLVEGVISVRAFGTKGDGLTDDTTSIQNALNEAGKLGGRVYLPPAKYVVRGSLSIPPNVMLEGVIDAPV